MNAGSRGFALVLLTLLLLATVLISLVVGAAGLPLERVVAALANRGDAIERTADRGAGDGEDTAEVRLHENADRVSALFFGVAPR